jgi:hypothetical protein
MMFAAWNDRWALVQYFIQECGASISDATSYGETLWDRLRLQNADPVAVVSLLKIMVMLDDAPPTFVAKLSPAQCMPSSPHRADTSVRSCRHTWSSSGLQSSSTAPCLLCCFRSSPSTPRRRLPLRTCGQMACASKHLDLSDHDCREELTRMRWSPF